MKTKVEKFRFIAKIAQEIACLIACFAFSASAASVAKVGETEYDTLEAAFVCRPGADVGAMTHGGSFFRVNRH